MGCQRVERPVVHPRRLARSKRLAPPDRQRPSGLQGQEIAAPFFQVGQVVRHDAAQAAQMDALLRRAVRDAGYEPKAADAAIDTPDAGAWAGFAPVAWGLALCVPLVLPMLGDVLGQHWMLSPLWQFALGTVYGGRILNAIRPFPEHKYQSGVETRTAMIMAGPFMSLLMLNNNLHVAHHDEPGVPWYGYHKLMNRVNAVERARDAGLLYEGGYAEVFRKFSFKPVDSPVRERN